MALRMISGCVGTDWYGTKGQLQGYILCMLTKHVKPLVCTHEIANFNTVTILEREFRVVDECVCTPMLRKLHRVLVQGRKHRYVCRRIDKPDHGPMRHPARPGAHNVLAKASGLSMTLQELAPRPSAQSEVSHPPSTSSPRPVHVVSASQGRRLKESRQRASAGSRSHLYRRSSRHIARLSCPTGSLVMTATLPRTTLAPAPPLSAVPVVPMEPLPHRCAPSIRLLFTMSQCPGTLLGHAACSWG